MGVLLQLSTGRRISLKSHNRVGRIDRADIVLTATTASQDHASIRWGAHGWELLDLGSRNGTIVNREKISVGTPIKLRAGMVLGFGNIEDLWCFENDAPPLPTAISLQTTTGIVAQHGLLCIDDGQGRVAAVYRHMMTAEWVFERDGEVSPVRDGDVVQVGDQNWHLVLPNEVAATEADSNERSIEKINLLFRVSRDESDINVIASVGTTSIDLGSHAHHHPLLALARARLKDGQDPHLPAAEHGWVHAAALVAALDSDLNRLNVDIYRARRQLAKAEIIGAERLVERRPLAHKLRLGIARFVIDAL